MSVTLRRPIPLFAFSALTLCLTSCGGSSSTPPPPAAISVSLNAPPTSLTAGGTASLTATVSNDSKGGGVTWTVTCASSPCGSFNPTSTASGVATTYTAPASPSTVTVTATSVSDTTKSASATVTITPLAISVTLNSPPTSLAVSATASLTAVVANDSKNGGVTWSVTCGGSPCGSFSPTSTASGAASTYTAPATVPTGNTVTVTATSVSDTTKSASATVTITPPPPPGLSVAFNPQPPASLTVGATTSLTAVVSNDSKNGGVTWSVTCGSSPCGSFSPTSTASGAATTYTAPATVPTPGTVTITATSVTDTTKSISATVAIAALLGDGTYVYHVAGQDAPANLAAGPYFVVGAFTVKGGVITGGEQDFRDFNNKFTDNLVASGCSITRAGGNIQITLATANTKVGANGIEVLRGAAVSSSRVLISEFDALAAATGSADLQTSAATPSGGYAFALSGLDELTTPSMLVIGGVLNFNAGALVVTGSVYDYNDGGTTIGQAQLFSSGSVNTPDAFGRVTFSLTTASTSAVPAFVLTGYIVGTNQIQLVESQTDTLGADLGGVALGQGKNTGSFNQAGLANTTYVHSSSGELSNKNLITLAGQFSFSSAGNVSGQLALNDGINFGASTISGVTSVVDPTGRVTLQGVNTSVTGLGPFVIQLYLDGNGNALELGVDSFEATQGVAYAQNAPPTDFEGTYAIAGQGYLPNPNGAAPAWGAVGPVTVNSDAFSGFTDYSIEGTIPTSGVTLTGTETNSTQLLSLTGLNGTGFTTANSYGYYPIDSKRVLAIEIDGNQLGLLQLESVSH